jgi:carboxylesterase type B
MISLFLYLSIFPACLVAAATSSLGPVVTLPQGSYAGNASFSGQVFFGGIPYAQPPVGDLRWRAPVKLENGCQGQGVRDARNWGPIW